MKAPQLLVDVARGKRDVEVEPAQTLRTAEELVQRHPEAPRAIVVRGAQGTEGIRIARALDRQERRVADRLHWKREGVIRLAGEEVALSRVVNRLRGAHASVAGAREAEISMLAVDGFPRRAILEREDDHSQRVPTGPTAYLVERRRRDAEDVVLDRLQLGRSRERAEGAA